MFFQRMCGPRLYFNNSCYAGSEYTLVSLLLRKYHASAESHFERDVRQFILATFLYNDVPSDTCPALSRTIGVSHPIDNKQTPYCFQYYKSQWKYHITVNRINLVQIELIIVRWANILGLKFLAEMFEML